MVDLRSTAPRVSSSDDDSGDTFTTTVSGTRPKRASAIYRRPIVDLSSDKESLEDEHDEIVTRTRAKTRNSEAKSGSRFVIDKVEG